MTLAGIIIVWEPIDLPASPSSALSRCLSQFICLAPRSARGWSYRRTAARRVAARLVGAVLALVEQDQVDVAAVALGAIDCLVGPPKNGIASKKALWPPAPRVRPALRRIEPAVRRPARVVVLHLVVVPDRDHRERGVEVAQDLVGAVERVLGAVVGERQRLAHVVVGVRGLASPMRRRARRSRPPPSGRPRRRRSRRGRPRSRCRRGASLVARCSSRACTPRTRRRRTARARASRPAARSGSARPGCARSRVSNR